MSVLLVATGGTIASRPTDVGVTAVLDGAALLERARIAEGVEVLETGRGPSWGLDPDAVESIARTAVAAAASGEHEGVVVTHGTDTIEETLFLSWLLGGSTASERAPIVFTGAMRNDGDPNTDGPANLRDAVALAAAGPLPGPVLRFGGVTHHARWVTKSDTTDVDTFRSPGASPIPPAPPPHADTIEPRVVQVPSHTGVDSGLVDWHLDRGARGIVVEGTGAGDVSGALVDGIERAIAAGVPVVVTSRCWTGSVAPIYGGRGGGWSLAAAGVIGGGDLPTHKARLALAVALGVDAGIDAVRAWFDELLAP
jgi:L-asparaginase